MIRYITKLVFNINIDKGKHTSQFDEQTRLIDAKNLEEAFFKARNIGRNEEVEFVNSEDKTVSWKFIDVSHIYALNTIKDGEQIYSTTHESEDANSFIQFIRQKSMVIQAKNLIFA